ncbi:nucleic acid binding protein [Red clover vein mosaic virus]|uniref:Nucleic acid binding protein n=1 Tax=Red clover vein mosaic virus TaxID=590403 RepID=C0L9F3_9VIRU|nr:nucleic acid binding protein [Red clover vein mosaic virus]ACN58193.1 nucleic acid binding protein [Red clover vein mosaic virus]
MDDVCISIVVCLRGLIPTDLCVNIAKRVAASKKIARRLPLDALGRGTSKSAVKRRCAKLGLCSSCGRVLHYGLCNKNQTYSQWELLASLRGEPIRLKAEKSLRLNSAAEGCNGELGEYISRLRPQ